MAPTSNSSVGCAKEQLVRQDSLLTRDSVAQHRKRPYIISRYRHSTTSYLQCLKSICSIHNETMNIWTHLIAAIYFLLLQFRLLNEEGISWTEFILFSLATCGGIAVFTLSAIFHTFECHTNDHDKWLFMDIFGMVLGICSQYPAIIYYGLWHEPFLRGIYMIAHIIAFTYTIWQLFMRPDQFYENRILWLSGWIAVSLVLFCHIVTINTDGGVVEHHVSSFVLGMAIAGFGAILYIVHFPENVLLGYVEVVGQSHSFWHIAMFIFTSIVLNFSLKVANERIEPDYLQNLII